MITSIGIFEFFHRLSSYRSSLNKSSMASKKAYIEHRGNFVKKLKDNSYLKY